MRQPSVLVPYPGPDVSVGTFDVFMYLRPETNGVLTESVIMKTIVSDPVWKEKVRLVYLANYPGDYIHTRHVIEHHYRLKIVFACRGGRAFTPGMRGIFCKKFHADFDEKRVIGAYEALKRFDLDEEQLFSYRVDEENMLITLGQNIKRYGDDWIVNYDIPAVLHRNTFETDIAVMVFRVKLTWRDFLDMVSTMSRHLAEAGVLGPDTPPSRAFHYSRSPWEQLLDGFDYLSGADVTDGGSEDNISFGAFMMEKGYSRQVLRDIIRNPLILHRDSAGVEKEANIFELSTGMDYPGAEAVLNHVIRHLLIPN
jgi:hypothetical protein